MENSLFDTQIGHDVHRAIELLKNGELVAIPTETVYGLAGNGLNEDAILKIFEAKNRPYFDPLILHIGHIDMLNKLVISVPVGCQKLIERFWPGPLTVILPKRNIVPDIATSGSSFVAVRMPNHRITLELLQALSFPVAAPSANPFKYVSPTSSNHVFQQLQGRIPYILDGGNCSIGLESTIVSFLGDDIKIQRLGGITVDEILEVLPTATLANQPEEHPVAPGQLKHHYAPNCKLICVEELENYKAQILDQNKKIGVVVFQNSDKAGIQEKLNSFGIPTIQIVWYVLSDKGLFQEAAQNLFATLRQLDDTGFDWAIFDWVPAIDLGMAINDRLKKAQYLPK